MVDPADNVTVETTNELVDIYSDETVVVEPTPEIVDVISGEDGTDVIPVNVATETVEILAEGPPGKDGKDGEKGERGPAGTADTQTYTFASGSKVWEVDNPFFPREPIAVTTDMNDSIMDGDVSFPTGKVRVEWYYDQTGYLRLT